MVATVATSTNTTPVAYSTEKKCFYANGRWWVWYSDGTNFGWKTSVDGIDWTGAFTSYGAYASAYYFDLWYDEANSKICLARCQGSQVANIYYRQGTANSDGSITWDSAEVQVTTDRAASIKVCKDSGGYPWISFTSTISPYNEYVVKVTATDGGAWGSLTSLWANRKSGQEDIIIIPLTNTKMMAISCAYTLKFQSRLYDGASWIAAVDASASTPGGYNGYFDAVADGDNVHLVFAKATSYNMLYVKYTYGTGWGSEETVEASCYYYYSPSITFKSTDSIRVFYLKSATTIKYRDRDAGAWQTIVTISSTEASMTCLSSSYTAFSSKFSVIWKSGASSPFNVKFEGYTLVGVTQISVAGSTIASGSLLRNKTLTVSGSTTGAGALLRGKNFALQGVIDGTGISTIFKTFAKLKVSGNIITLGSVKVNKKIIVSGDAIATGILLTGKTLTIQGLVDALGNITIAGAINEIDVLGNIVAQGSITINKTIIIKGDVSAIGKALIDKPVSVQGLIDALGIVTTGPYVVSVVGDRWLGPPVPKPTFPVHLLTLIRDYLETKQNED